MFKERRLIGLLLVMALIMVLALAACGGDDDDEEEPTSTPTVEVVETEEAEPTEEVAEAEPTEEVMEAEPTEEVMEAEPTEEVMEAEPTEEVMEAEPTEEVMEAEPTEEVMEAEPTEEVMEAGDQPLRITLVVNGVLGDKSFFDSAQRGMDRLLAEGYNVEVNTIELGIDPANWETGLADAMSQVDDYDMLIVGTFQMGEFLAARVHQYPDKYFVFYDDSVPYDNEELCVEGCPNVYSVTYAQNEGSFLAGVYAAAMSQSDLEGMNADAILGAIGGQDIPVINDFIVGYEQGACLVNPASSVLVQYAGGWNDPAKGKEIALAMYEQKADIVFQIAGGTGVGVFEAAQEQGKYAIGVDSDQATIILETDPDQAERILTSMLKNVDNSLYRAVDLHLAGELDYGQAEALGIAEGGVGLAINEIYEDATPDNVKELIAAVEEAVTNGDIVVNTVFGDDAAEVGMGCDEMPEADLDVAAFLGELPAAEAEMEAEPTEEVMEAEPTEEVMEAEPTEEVMEAEPTEEVMEAEPTEEMMEAEPTEEVMEAEATEEAEETVGMEAELGVVTIGLNAEYPPFEFVEDGEIMGFDPALMEAIAERAGFDIEWVNTRWDGIFVALQSGEFDAVISAATITDDREEIVDFSNPYFDSGQGQMIAVREEDAETITTADDLVGLAVGVQAGTTGDLFVSDITGVEVERYDEITLAFQALGAGEIDAVVNDGPVSEEIISSNPELGVVLVGDQLTREMYGIAVNPERPDLLDAVNAGLAEVIADGTYATIYEEWFGEEPPADFMPE